MKAPAVFVSSTFYDLKQIRADLRDFIAHLGLIPIISEFDSFPIDPSVSAVENCLKVVDQSADIFVLIISGRYGTVKDQDKSVTNMEYLKARAKGIPIYVFIDKAVLYVLPLWTASPQSDFSAVVDSPKLFEFVMSVRSTDAVWTLPFETAQDIIEGSPFALEYTSLAVCPQAIKRSPSSATHCPEYFSRFSCNHLSDFAERLACACESRPSPSVAPLSSSH